MQNHGQNSVDILPGQPVQRQPTVILSLSARRWYSAFRHLEDVDWRSRSDPYCSVMLINSYGSGTESLGKTEVINSCLDPVWTRKIAVPYRFEQNQQLMFEIRDLDHDFKKFLGSLTVSLAEIMNAPGNRITRNIVVFTNFSHFSNDRQKQLQGELTITAEQLAEGRQESIYMACSASKLDKKDFMDKSDPFIQLQRINNDGSLLLAHRTRYVGQNLNPKWRPFEIPLSQLCYGDHQKEFLIECLDHDDNGRHDLIGTCKTTVERIANKIDVVIPLINEKKALKKGKKYTNSGELRFDHVVLWNDYTILDFISSGTELKFTIAVDFTKSNGPVTDCGSLHYLNDRLPNQYQIAIRAIGEIVQFYCKTRTFNAYGFGAKLPGDAENVHFAFPLNLGGDPTVTGVDGLLAAYGEAAAAVTMAAPTNFLPIVRRAAQRSHAFQKAGENKYGVLVILTDGEISDIDQTRDEIVRAAVLPLSIIIVGIGYETFTRMRELDSDKKFLTNSKGAAARRDIVQFVELRKFLPPYKATRPDEYDQAKAQLAKEVLYEIPNQLTDYMKSKGILPAPRELSRDDEPQESYPSLREGKHTSPH